MRARFVMAALATAAIVVVVLLVVWPRLATRGPEPSGNALPRADDARAASSASPSLAMDQSLPSRRDAIALPATFRIVVVDGARRPIADAAVLAWCDGDAVFIEHRSDSDGAIVLPAREANGGLVAVQRDGAIGLAHPIAWRGEHTLVVGEGATLTGSVTVAGQPAPADLAFALATTDFGVPATAPHAVNERLQELAGTRRLVTAAGGAFVARGLPATWHGTLTAPPGHRFVSAGAGICTPRWLRSLSHGDLVVDLVHLPSVRGLARWTDGSPVSQGSIVVQAELAGRTKVYGQAVIEGDGRYVVGLEPEIGGEEDVWMRASSHPAFVRGTLFCGGVQGLADTVEVPLGANALVDEVEVVLTLAPRVHFVVVDFEGAPIAGARVSVDGSDPTDAAGRSFYRGKEPRLVGAPRHAVVPATSVGGDGSEASPFRFRLPSRNEIVIEVVTSHGPAPAGLEVELQASSPLFAGRQDWSPLHGAFGGSEGQCGEMPWVEEGLMQRRHLLMGRTEGRGRVVFHSLEPGTEGEIVVRDRSRSDLARASFAAPVFGEAATVRLVVEAQLVLVYGQVRGADGAPSQGAMVWMHGPLAGCEQTAADGRFQRWVRRGHEPVEVIVELPGHVLERRRAAAPGDGDFGVIRLHPGRSITVRVVDDAGAPVDLFAQPVGHERIQQQNPGVGVWIWSGMPSEVVFCATVSGRRFEAFAGPGDDEVVLRATQVAKVWAPAEILPPETGVALADACVLLHALDDPAAPAEQMSFSIRDFTFRDPSSRSVLPGRYRAELARRRTLPDGTVHVEGLGITRDLELRAGQTVEIRF